MYELFVDRVPGGKDDQIVYQVFPGLERYTMKEA